MNLRSSISDHIKRRLKTITPAELFILLAIAFSIVFLVKYFGLKQEWRTIRVEVAGRNWSSSFNPYGYRTPFWMSDKLRAGQIEKNPSGKKIAEVVSIENYERGDEEAEVYLTVKVKAQLNKRTEKYVFKGRALDLGAPIELKLSNILVLGQIIDDDMPSDGYEQKEIIIVGRWRSQDPWKIQQIKVGDTMTNRATGEMVGEILDLSTGPPTMTAFIFHEDQEGQRLLLKQPSELRDAVVKVKIKVHKQDSNWYFGGHQKVKVGELLWIYTDKIDINGLEVQEIRELK